MISNDTIVCQLAFSVYRGVGLALVLKNASTKPTSLYRASYENQLTYDGIIGNHS